MQNFSRKLITEWRNLNLPFSDKNIIIAVSGGADSCALLFAVHDLFKQKKLLNKFIVAHFNHNLRREEAHSDASFVKSITNKLGFQFITEVAERGKIDTDKNIEESARKARYDFLLKTANNFKVHSVLTAHTINDQAETFLLNLLRGSGIEGLSGMKTVRKLNEQSEVLLVRPFLSWAYREDIEKFVKKNKIQFQHDSMNDDFNFKRVQIRKDLIPYLKNFNPQIIETLNSTSQNLRNENELIKKFLLDDLEFNKLINSDQLKVIKLQSLSDAMIYKVLRGWLNNKRGHLRSLEFIHFKAILRLIFSTKSGKFIELPKFQLVIKDKGNLIFQDGEVEK